MSKKLLEKIKKYHWIYTWSGNFPLLDCACDRGIKFQKEHIRISGNTLKNTVSFFENGIVTWYRAKEDDGRLAAYYLKKFDSDSKFLVKSVRDYRKRVNNDLKCLREIFKVKKLGSLSNTELIELFKKGKKHLLYNWTIDIYDWYMEVIFTPVLQAYLEKRLAELGKLEMLTEYVNTLVTPHQVSVIFKERQRLFDIVRFIRRDKELMNFVKRDGSFEQVSKKSRKLKKLFEKYLEDYLWMPVYVNNPASTIKSVWKEIISFIKSDAPFQVKAKRLGDNYDKKIILRSKEYVKELNPPKNIKDLISGLQRMAFLRTEDYVVMSESSYNLISLYTEIGRRLGVTYRELKEFLPEEIIVYLGINKRIDRNELKKRITLSCFITFENEEHLLVGKGAEALKKAIESQFKTEDSSQKVFQGVGASLGKVTGKVLIGTSLKQASKIKNSQILVVSSASNVFAPYLRKASGIISEFGGLTSHPVIIAREFKIPCIVGIADITKILKNGDVVQIDGEKGIVKILK